MSVPLEPQHPQLSSVTALALLPIHLELRLEGVSPLRSASDAVAPLRWQLASADAPVLLLHEFDAFLLPLFGIFLFPPFAFAHQQNQQLPTNLLASCYLQHA